jgi:hypothetical protein
LDSGILFYDEFVHFFESIFKIFLYLNNINLKKIKIKFNLKKNKFKNIYFTIFNELAFLDFLPFFELQPNFWQIFCRNNIRMDLPEF